MTHRILVVDDSTTVRQQVGQALSQAGFEVIEAIDGQDGLDKIATHPGLMMVIADVNMPTMNGLEMLEKLKADPKNSKLIVFMLTTEGQPELIERAKKAGAKGWIVKPFKAESLVAAAKKLAASL
jgi:two-component system, chemotaxis family, chemotaxis protein CheY